LGSSSRDDNATSADVVLEGTTDQKTGTVTLSRKTGSFNFALKFTGALDQSTGEAVPITSDGLPSAARAAFHFSRWHWPGPSQAEQEKYRERCVTVAKKCTGGCLVTDVAEGDRAAFREASAVKPPTEENLWDLRELCLKWTNNPACSPGDIGDPIKRKEAEVLRKGERGNISSFCEKKATACNCLASDFSNEQEREEALHLLHADRKPFFIGGGVELGRTRFKYLDRATLDPQAANHNDWLVIGRAGVFLAPVGFVLASYSYSQAFSPAPSTSLCTPLSGTSVPGATTCRTVALGAPTADKGSTVGLELRRISASGIGIAPAVRYLFDSDVTTVEVPIYFIPGSDKSMVGGVRVGWRSDQKNVTVSVFVGGAFGLVPQ
jgi:hypothetical protein